MLSTLIESKIRITDVRVIQEYGYFYCVVYYSDGNYDEFGPYDSYSEARSAVY